MNQEIVVSKKDIVDFQRWLNLDWDNLTWQGRYEKEFKRFWELLCLDEANLEKVLDKLSLAKKKIKAGPLYSWLMWLEEKILLYLFITRNVSLSELARQSQMPPNKVGLILRNFFIDLFPHLEEYFNIRFQVGNILSPNSELRFSEIEQDVSIPAHRVVGGHDDEVMRSLEVTLYPEWKELVELLEQKSSRSLFGLKDLTSNVNFNRQIRFLQEVIILFFVGWLVVFLVTKLNQWYELKLSDKISIYQPDFIRLNKSLVFKEEVPHTQIQLQIKELEEFTKDLLPNQNTEVDDRLDTESEGSFASFEDLPRNLEESQAEVHALEELKKQQNMAYRDGVSGGNKVYRVMFNTVDALATGSFLAPLLQKYKITFVNKAKSFTSVPGGMYYNLHVPNENLKDFLVKVANRGDVDIFESHTKMGVIPGKNKVFIWVKEI